MNGKQGLRQLVIVTAVAMAALALSGCGVRGPLEVPRESAGPVETGNATPGSPGAPVAHKPSVLDPLIR
jgi:predicted small lipoprotein YifL